LEKKMSSSLFERFRLENKVAVVTGGAGILGSVVCEALADAGGTVAVIDRDLDLARDVATKISVGRQNQAQAFGCDITDEVAFGAVTNRIEENLGPIDVLHNNAATKGSDVRAFFASVEDYDMNVWREVMSVNLDGLFTVARVIGSKMASRGRGSIIQTASIYGATAGPDQRIYEGSDFLGGPINTPPVYAASKAGVVGLTNFLATYWGAQGVRVNTITPGGISSGQNSEFSQKYSARVPLGRMARADEVALAVVFLASDASSYITGHNLIVDGGLSTW
jgi:NAD(P)-dependent dehydrogenase (short-subunit alcohol dehydrogenase family)